MDRNLEDSKGGNKVGETLKPMPRSLIVGSTKNLEIESLAVDNAENQALVGSTNGMALLFCLESGKQTFTRCLFVSKATSVH
jgi:hypothetical protein